MHNCPVCGTELPATARFCSHCGHTLNTPGESDGTTNVEDSPLPDEQPVDISVEPTQSLTKNKEHEEAEVSVLANSTLPEKQRTLSSQQADEDQGEPRSRAMLLDVPEAEAPLKPPASPAVPAPSLPPHVPATQRGNRSSAARWLIPAIIALVLIAGGLSALFILLRSHSQGSSGASSTVTGPSSNTGVTPPLSSSTAVLSPTPINDGTVDLTFSGAVVGHMSAASVVTCGADQSPAGGMQYHVAVFGTVGGQQYALTFGAYPYTAPSTYTSTAFSFFGPAGENSAIAQWRSGPKQSASVTINSDGKTGTLDIGYLSSSDNSSARVAGSWKCV
jgi:zinc-ribbon domain